MNHKGLSRAALSVPIIVAITALAGSAANTVARPAAAARQTRYSLVHRCYALRSPGSHRPIASPSGPFRMQAAALGVYLLYTRGGSYLTDQGGGSLSAVPTPSRAVEWRVGGSSAHGFTLTNLGTSKRLRVAFAPARGCAVYPEAQAGATGTPPPAWSAAAKVFGTAEGHAHITAQEFFGGDWHCGTPFSPFGAPYALPASCAHYQQGANGAFESVLDFGSPTRPSDMHGWPTFKEWPTPTSLAEEGDYWTALERAWLGGLRLVVSNNVDNEQLCKQMTTTSHDCLDMTSVRLQAHDLYALQDYIDAQSGGPGKGFFRIVLNPFQARRVINAGKMAVIMGIEVSKIFECGEYNHVPTCTRSDVDKGLAYVEKLGVRTFFPVHEFDNAFGGSKGISGESGVIINAGQRNEDGYFFNTQPCPAEDQDAQEVAVDPTGAYGQLLSGPFSSLGNPAPVYSTGPQCNTQGLTELGAYLINRMIRQHLIIQLDHMDSKTADQALAIAQAHHYAGVVAAHCCGSHQLFKRIYATGGAVDASKDQPQAFLHMWHDDSARRSARYAFGFGFGSDMNGLSQQTGPNVGKPVHYPFTAYGGKIKFKREVWGQRTFDINTDGVANYGMYADWLQAVRVAAGPAFMRDMYSGAEQYLEMWERAYGVPAEHCLSPAKAASIHVGQSFPSVLLAAGQPRSRSGGAYVYCLAGGGRLTAHFGPVGRTSAVTIRR